MNVSPIQTNNINNQSFRHDVNFWSDKSTPVKDKLVVAGSVLTGTAVAAALMAKHAGYSLSPCKMFKNIKKSYLSKIDFEAPQVIALGAGSCIGGLTGGYLIDKNPVNRKAKRREAVMQFGNISIPILTVAGAHALTKKHGKVTSSVASVGAVFIGVYMANFLMNKLGNALFHNKSEARKVKPTDFSAHLDDFVLAATYISKAQLVHALGRLVPIALMVPGNEIGNKKARDNFQQM